ncbi:MAG: AMP-binding protein, partial [Halieaceae bacterium]
FASPWVGAIALPLNSRLSQSEMQYILQDAGTRVLITDEEFSEQATTLLTPMTGVSKLLCFSDMEIPSLSEEAPLDGAPPPEPAAPSDTAVLF